MRREFTRLLNEILDRGLPPFIRESRVFYRPLLRTVVKSDVNKFLDFRDNAWQMSEAEMQTFYAETFSNIDRPTDCNLATLRKIISHVNAHDISSIVEFGCGRGHLAGLLLEETDCDYTGLDFDVKAAQQALNGAGNFQAITSISDINVEAVPDCVITTHTLEHVIDVRQVFNDLWNMTGKMLIIVVPLQMNLRYTPDLHTRFWRRYGDFFIDAGITKDMNPEWEIINNDLYVLIRK